MWRGGIRRERDGVREKGQERKRAPEREREREFLLRWLERQDGNNRNI